MTWSLYVNGSGGTAEDVIAQAQATLDMFAGATAGSVSGTDDDGDFFSQSLILTPPTEEPALPEDDGSTVSDDVIDES